MLHCASQPWRVTASASLVMVVEGKPWFSHGLPGEVEKRLSSSASFKAPSRSFAVNQRGIFGIARQGRT